MLPGAPHTAPQRRLAALSSALARSAAEMSAPGAPRRADGKAGDTTGVVPAADAYTLPPDPWTNAPDGQGTGTPLPPRLTMTPEELYLYELHGYLCASHIDVAARPRPRPQ